MFEPSFALQNGHTVGFIVEILMREAASTVMLCAIGPLTNIALAIEKQQTIADRIERIVLMGGGYFTQVNITPSAEFNIYADTEAARIFFASGAPIVMMPLDVTHKVLTTPKRVERIRGVNNPAPWALVEMLTFYGRYNEKKDGAEGGPLHDPTTIAWMLRPDLFSGRECNVEIETVSELTRGATVVDWWRVTDRGTRLWRITWTRTVFLIFWPNSWLI